MKQKLSLKGIHRIHFNLIALDGRDDQPQTRNQKGEIVNTPATRLKPYKFEGGARWAIARNIRKLGNIVEDFESSRKRIFREHAGENTELVAGTPEHARFSDAVERQLDEVVDVDVYAIKIEDLKAEDNGIPGSVLGGIDELLAHADGAQAKE